MRLLFLLLPSFLLALPSLEPWSPGPWGTPSDHQTHVVARCAGRYTSVEQPAVRTFRATAPGLITSLGVWVQATSPRQLLAISVADAAGRRIVQSRPRAPPLTASEGTLFDVEMDPVDASVAAGAEYEVRVAAAGALPEAGSNRTLLCLATDGRLAFRITALSPNVRIVPGDSCRSPFPYRTGLAQTFTAQASGTVSHVRIPMRAAEGQMPRLPQCLRLTLAAPNNTAANAAAGLHLPRPRVCAAGAAVPLVAARRGGPRILRHGASDRRPVPGLVLRGARAHAGPGRGRAAPFQQPLWVCGGVVHSDLVVRKPWAFPTGLCVSTGTAVGSLFPVPVHASDGGGGRVSSGRAPEYIAAFRCGLGTRHEGTGVQHHHLPTPFTLPHTLSRSSVF